MMNFPVVVVGSQLNNIHIQSFSSVLKSIFTSLIDFFLFTKIKNLKLLIKKNYSKNLMFFSNNNSTYEINRGFKI